MKGATPFSLTINHNLGKLRDLESLTSSSTTSVTIEVKRTPLSLTEESVPPIINGLDSNFGYLAI